MFGYSVELLAGVDWQTSCKPVPEASIVPERSTFNSAVALSKEFSLPFYLFWCVLGPTRIEDSAHTFPMDSITLGILRGESYNGIRALVDLFVTLKYPIFL